MQIHEIPSNPVQNPTEENDEGNKSSSDLSASFYSPNQAVNSIAPPRPEMHLDTSHVVNYHSCVTPRRQEALYSCIAHTPNGEETHVFKYYCPLCMSFFRDILKSSCCGNYTCFPCCIDFLGIRGIKVRINNLFYSDLILYFLD